MKIQDLDRNQIYDLRGITHEQAEELLQWLIENDSLEWHIDDFRTYDFLFFEEHSKWDASRNLTSTAHISTLFEEKSYEEQLIEAVKRVEILKEKVKQLKEPKVGDVCKFWDEDEGDFVIGKLSQIDTDMYPYLASETNYHKYAKKLNQQEVIELLYGAN